MSICWENATHCTLWEITIDDNYIFNMSSKFQWKSYFERPVENMLLLSQVEDKCVLENSLLPKPIMKKVYNTLSD